MCTLCVQKVVCTEKLQTCCHFVLLSKINLEFSSLDNEDAPRHLISDKKLLFEAIRSNEAILLNTELSLAGERVRCETNPKMTQISQSTLRSQSPLLSFG